MLAPLPASLCDAFGHFRRVRLDVVGQEQHLAEETRRSVPRDVAVERPDPRVLHVHLHDDVAARLHVLHVAARWVVGERLEASR